MSLSATQKVYVDSSVFLGWLCGNTGTVHRTQQFLNQITSGQISGIVSTLVLNEVIKVIRKILVERGMTARQWNQNELQAIRSIFGIQGLTVVKGEPNETQSDISLMTFGKISSAALAIIKRYPGRIRNNRRTGRPEHDGISPVDSYHIVLAKRFHCDALATLDHDFNETSPEIAPMII